MTIGTSSDSFLDYIEEETAKSAAEIRGCAPRCLSPLMKYLNLADQTTIEVLQKAALPLSGGIVQGYGTCGALLGGIMAIGIALFDGKVEDAPREKMMVLNEECRKYYRIFEKEIGHARCFDIRQAGLGRCFDTADPGEYDRFVEAGGHELCAKVVAKAARLAANLILEMQPYRKEVAFNQKAPK